MNKFLKIFLAAVLAVFASACEEPVGGNEGPALNQDLSFTLKLEEVTSAAAKIKVQHNGTSDDTWYGFVTDTQIKLDNTAKALKEAQNEINENSKDIVRLETELKEFRRNE